MTTQITKNPFLGRTAPRAERRLFEQLLCQRHYTRGAYTQMAVYKFFLPQVQRVPRLTGITFQAFTLNKRAISRFQRFNHYLFLLFHQQQVELQWLRLGELWQAVPSNPELFSYLLRYQWLAYLNVFPFVPNEEWRKYHPRQTWALPWLEYLPVLEDFPLIIEDYLFLEFENQYRLTTRLFVHKDPALPKWYAKVFALRRLHYPVTYNPKRHLPLLTVLRQFPLTTPLTFDHVASGGKRNVDWGKKRLLKTYMTLLKLRKTPRLITEYAINYRLNEQLTLSEDERPAATHFQFKWAVNTLVRQLWTWKKVVWRRYAKRKKRINR